MMDKGKRLSYELLSMLIDKMRPRKVSMAREGFNGQSTVSIYKCSFNVFDGSEYHELIVDYGFSDIELEQVADIGMLADWVEFCWKLMINNALKSVL